ncbi:MAG: hydroxylamine reductase [Candidatus Omnitrophota bacterium]
MFCRQCEQTAKGVGCTIKGICGKEEPVAILQDALTYNLVGIGVWGKLARDLGIKDKQTDLFIIEGLFTTVTNVNFDPIRIKALIDQSIKVKENIKKFFLKEYKKKKGKDFKDVLPFMAEWIPAAGLDALVQEAQDKGIQCYSENEDLRSLKELLLYGLRGMAAYADHARVLGQEDEEINAFFYKALSALADNSLSADELTKLNLTLGTTNLKCMKILDHAHTDLLGHPAPQKVKLGVKKGPAIIVSGHDLLDLKQLLEQTKSAGVNIYTHGEMLPAHGYPELNKYKHLAGNFGTAWQNQQSEFDNVPAAILMTTNCIQKPKDSYKDRIFTTGLVGWPDIKHIPGTGAKKDFNKVIAKALELGGFKEEKINKEILVGFAHNAILSVADKVIAAVKAKQIRRFFLIGGCDGAKPGRNYYTDFAQKVPQDCVILTLACGKYRFNSFDFGNISGIPRLLDCGQCNDAYSAVKVAGALASAFGCGVNELPLSLILSWYEQKAVCILVSLLSLGIKNIKLGPTLPAFISQNVLKVLVDKFNISPVTTPDNDLNAILNASNVGSA